MHSDKIVDDYIELIKSDREKYSRDYLVTKEMVANSSAYYKGEPVPFDYQPFFIDPIDKESFDYILDSILGIGKKVIREYKKNPEYRKLFSFPKFIEDMILVDNGYGVSAPMGRFDVFYKDREHFKFCEINTDGSSAMNEDNVIAKILLQSEGLRDFSKKYELSYFELFDSWVDESLKLYKRYDSDNSHPNVAIMDFMESASKTEFKEFKKAYEKRGLNCEIVDVRDMEYRDGKLYAGDFRIDMIYRRLVTFELIERKEEASEFIKAYMDRAVCTIGSIESQIIHNKIFFKVLFDEETRDFLNEDEIEFIDKHIPFTGILGGDRKILDELIKNKDKYIIKPMDKNASTGVYAGLDLSDAEWKKRLEEDFDNDTIYQEFVSLPKNKFVEFTEDGELKVEELTNMVGIFSYNEKVAGFYTRMGRDTIIDGMHDYVTAPTILAVRRDMDDILPRINELSKISKERDLTLDETLERDELRKEYLKRFRAGMEKTILNLKVVDEGGNDITEDRMEELFLAKKKKN